MSQLDTLLQARLAGRRQHGSFWSSSGRGILVIAALNIVLLWSVTGGVVWQSYRDAVDDWKRTATNFSLTTAAYAQQTLVATDLMLRSMLDWIADEDIVSESQFTNVMKEHRFHDAIRDRLVGLPQVGVASIFNKEGHLLSSSSGWPAPSIYIGERETFLAQIGPNSPPVSTIEKRVSFHVTGCSIVSRVVPASDVTMARRVRVMRLKSVDLPTFGRPASTTSGSE